MTTADGITIPWRWAPSGHVSMLAEDLLCLRSPIAVVRIAGSESLLEFHVARMFATRFSRLRVQSWRRASRRLRDYVRAGGDPMLALGVGERRIITTLETITDVRARERVFAGAPRNDEHAADVCAQEWLRTWAEGERQ